ncbi:prepilin-type N-terminal cleavage/methylation domain-containing protein [Clostridium sp. USBA 49]|jgi:prepilin-type N-terminal cleavage/methylation domain-containing protein|uniref:type II secretion system protein n=1 Tax=Clostridium sp. USBA 49 TaxID=1881060 RepID=UPI00099B0975|nr:type II secretion system protein [Clostridium sp. USBA 49]SKA76879.1 prepilin-type N-terminal cleavage/methylation domain-containing protein [Clostridium sp. USBA 49]
MKKGFTLIEVLVTMSIITLLIPLTNFFISNYKKLQNDNDIKMCQIMIVSIINNSKQYCREKNKSGYILFDIAKDEIIFYCDGNKKDNFLLPKGIDLKSINTNYYKIDINNFGITNDAGTISIKDRYNKIYEITINVGVGHVEIK